MHLTVHQRRLFYGTEICHVRIDFTQICYSVLVCDSHNEIFIIHGPLLEGVGIVGTGSGRADGGVLTISDIDSSVAGNLAVRIRFDICLCLMAAYGCNMVDVLVECVPAWNGISFPVD